MRRRTASDVKWLVNEAAALAGELERLDQEMNRLVSRREAVCRAHNACVQTLAYVSGHQSLPNLPTVRTHRAYGGRGNLRAFLQDVLRESAPQSFTTGELAGRAIEHFNLQFSSPKELYAYKVNSVGRALQKLQTDGLIVRLVARERVKGAWGTWCWKHALPTFATVVDAARGPAAGCED